MIALQLQAQSVLTQTRLRSQWRGCRDAGRCRSTASVFFQRRSRARNDINTDRETLLQLTCCSHPCPNLPKLPGL